MEGDDSTSPDKSYSLAPLVGHWHGFVDLEKSPTTTYPFNTLNAILVYWFAVVEVSCVKFCGARVTNVHKVDQEMTVTISSASNAVSSLRNILSATHIGKRNSSNKRERNTNSINLTEIAAISNGGSSSMEDPNSLLPQYLLPLVRHYHDDFYVSRSFEPRLIVQLMAEGFLPIATRGYLLPKLHVERCVLQLNPNSHLHVSRSTKKKSKKFMFSVNTCFGEVVAGCHRQQ